MAFDKDFGDLSSLAIPPDEDWETTRNERSIPLSKILPALGLAALEKNRFGFHVTGGLEAGENLAEAFGEDSTLLIDAERFNPDFFTHQVDVLSQGGASPVRAIFQNLSAVRPEGVYELEKLFDRGNGYPIKSVWFIDDGGEVESNLRAKVLMRCRMVDADTLLDAVAFGWGSQNPYDGQPVGGPVDMYGHDRDSIDSEEPLFNTRAVLPDSHSS